MSTLLAENTQTGLRASLEGSIARIEIDTPDSKVNKLTTAFMTELARVLETLAADPDVRAVVLTSGKRDSFVAGADLEEIEALESAQEAQEKAEFGQRVFARLEGLGKPVVAAVHGACLGGGCEMILACHHRILGDDPSTRIGLPEVRLGILPGFGGTQRLPRVVGVRAALDLILTGKTVDARKALRIGLADEVVYPALLLEASTAAARRLIEKGAGFSRHRARQSLLSVPGFLDRTRPGRALLFRMARRRVRRDTRGNYPAPLAALEAVRAGAGKRQGAYAREAELLGELAAGTVSKNLIRLFRLGEANRKVGADLPSPHEVRNMGIVGAGVMGGGIAELAAGRDVDVRLKDLVPEAILAAYRTARDLMEKKVRRRRLDRWQMEAKMARISASLEYTGFEHADLVLEAVVEKTDVKQAVLREIESHVGESCVLATNTSALSVTRLGEGLRRPQQFLGMHFFNPVHRMPLVEVIRTPQTDPKAVSTVLALARRLGKTPILVQDGPGFLVNRVLAPYMNESAFLFEEGCDLEHLDRLMRRFGMPMGPFELLDEVGTDVACKVGEELHTRLGERARPASLAASLYASGRLGRKTGRGVYKYEGPGGHRRRPDRKMWRTLRPAGVTKTPTDEVIMDRVFGLMINEAALCLEEGIVGSAGEVDLALVYGIGFPPFHGGLLKYGETRGLGDLVDRMRVLETQLGPRFTASDPLRRMAASGERFDTNPNSAPLG